MAFAEKIRVRSADVAEIVAAVDHIYCPHTITLRRLDPRMPAVVEVVHAGLLPVIELRYATPVKIDAGHFPRLMLMQSCLDGAGTATQNNVTVACKRGQTLPLSPGRSTRVDYDARFAQRSVRLDVDRIETACARMLNHPLDRPLAFELRPFAPQLEQAWGCAVALTLRYEQMGIALPAAAAANFDDFLISLVLTQHPHNYTDDLQGRTRAASPRLIREAEHLMRSADGAMTAGEIAARLRVSLRSLEAGFRDHLRTTPTRRLRDIRLAKVREQLLTPTASTSVTATALENGFVHLARFSGYYRAAFGESPAMTLRRSRRSV